MAQRKHPSPEPLKQRFQRKHPSPEPVGQRFQRTPDHFQVLRLGDQPQAHKEEDAPKAQSHALQIRAAEGLQHRQHLALQITAGRSDLVGPRSGRRRHFWRS
jgi:hypothetical protein